MQEVRSKQFREHLAEFSALTETVDQFDGYLFVRLVERVVVKAKHVVFGLNKGIEISEKVGLFGRSWGNVGRKFVVITAG